MRFLPGENFLFDSVGKNQIFQLHTLMSNGWGIFRRGVPDSVHFEPSFPSPTAIIVGYVHIVIQVLVLHFHATMLGVLLW